MSEKVTDSRRAALRDRGIYPRSRDLNVLFSILGGIVAFRSLNLDFSQSYQPFKILALSIVIPTGVALGSVFATLIQSRFLFRFSFFREKQELSFSNSFYSILKLILAFTIGGILFRKILSDASVGDLVIGPALSSATGVLIGLLVLFALVGMLVSRFTFVQTYQMTKAEMDVDAREGEMRPEVRAAVESSYADSEGRD